MAKGLLHFGHDIFILGAVFCCADAGAGGGAGAGTGFGSSGLAAGLGCPILTGTGLS